MLNGTEITSFETQLVAERPRLVRLCAWLTGNPETAEDLAQEVCLVAWKNREQLYAADKLKPWLSGIARNICLDWTGRRWRDKTRQVVLSGLDDEALWDGLSDASNMEFDLDRMELAQLLDQALALLPSDTARLPVTHCFSRMYPTAILGESLGCSIPVLPYSA